MASSTSSTRLLLFMATLSIFGVASGVPKTEAAAHVLSLLNDPTKYDKAIIPLQNKSSPLEVVSTMHIRNVDIDDVNMRTNVDLTFRLHWRDYRLSLDTEGVSRVRFSDTSKFWIPDVFFKNSFKTEQMETVYPEAYIQVSDNGDILYSSRFILNLRCEMDLSRFPHDTQDCPLYVASYGHSTDDIDLLFEEEEPFTVVQNVLLSNTFSIKTISTSYCTSKTSTGEYGCLKLEFSLVREFNTYLLEWYLPCVSFVIIAFFAEFLEVSALLPRLLLTVGPLLTLTAASLNYSQNLASVPYTTSLDLFTGMSLLAIFVTVLHVLISHYYSLKPVEEVKPDEEESSSSGCKNVLSKIKERGNQFAKIAIIGIYSAFIFLYFLAYML